MANTRDTIGDQETVDALVSNTLTSLEEDGITNLADYALYYKTALTSVNLPNVVKLGQYSLYGCTGLTSLNLPKVIELKYDSLSTTGLVSIELPKANIIRSSALSNNANLETVNLSGEDVKTIEPSAFYNNKKLTHLLINSSSMSTLSSTNAFSGTKIARKSGAIYVPTNLVSTYKSGTNWSNFIIADINDYPLTNFDTISDSWDTIIANNNYATDYNIGDIKTMNLGAFGDVCFELAAKDADIKADNTGNARMTWVLKDILTNHSMNSTNITTGGYDASAMKAYLISDVLPQIPSNVRNAIVPVTKISSTYENNALVKDGQTTSETIWLLSQHEVFNKTLLETTGPVYNGILNSAANRIKYNSSGTASLWWLRSTDSSTRFRYVGDNGGDNVASYVGSSGGVVFGFCI